MNFRQGLSGRKKKGSSQGRIRRIRTPLFTRLHKKMEHQKKTRRISGSAQEKGPEVEKEQMKGVFLYKNKSHSHCIKGKNGSLSGKDSVEWKPGMIGTRRLSKKGRRCGGEMGEKKIGRKKVKIEKRWAEKDFF